MLFIGIDVGGTNIASGLVNDKGEVLKRDKRPTEATKGSEYVIKNIVEAVNNLAKEVGIENIKGIGLGIPGYVDPDEGISRFSVNLGWENIPVVIKLKENFSQTPIFMENDVRVAALGEKYFGAGRGFNNLIMITLGTGVGSAIIINGELYRGATGSAGEIGHTTVFKDGLLCRCGNRGCLELYASATGIVKKANDYIKEGNFTIMMEMIGHDLSKITARLVSEACGKGDKLAMMVMEEAAEVLAVGIVNCVNIIDPEIVIIGGGVSLAGEKLFTPLNEAVRKRLTSNIGQKIKIVPAKWGDEGGMIGAAVLAMVRMGVIAA